jgi:PAT family acetyl-CoA transporter-like MFS transporter 1
MMTRRKAAADMVATAVPLELESGPLEMRADRLSRSDVRGLVLLLLLYTLQGIPMGLAASMPYLLQERAPDFEKQATFSTVSLPFSLKLLWAPIIDSLWIRDLGHRKTWLLPVQLAIGLTMLWASFWVDSTLDTPGGPPIWTLTGLFFFLYTMCATQDIAVDGWALTILSPQHVSKGPICNSIGQHLGYSVSFICFMALSDTETCNIYFRSVPSDKPIATLGTFLALFGVLFLLSLVLLVLTKERAPVESPQSVMDTYRNLWRVCQLPTVQALFCVLVTMRIAFSVVDAAGGFKLQEYGVPKGTLATIGSFMLPVALAVPTLLGRFATRPPAQGYMSFYPLRILMGFVSLGLVYFIWTLHEVDPVTRHSVVPVTLPLTAAIFVVLAVGVAVNTAMFTCMIQFFSLLSDPTIGGSYMTLLNTIANFGGAWPNSLALKAVGIWERCEPLADGVPCVKHDGFFPMALFTLCIGLVWWATFGPLLRKLSALSVNAWRVTTSGTANGYKGKPQNIDRTDVLGAATAFVTHLVLLVALLGISYFWVHGT